MRLPRPVSRYKRSCPAPRSPVARAGRLSATVFWPIIIRMLTKQKLAEINSRGSRPEGRGPALYAAVGALAAAVAAGLLVSYVLGGAVLFLGAVIFLFLVRRGSGGSKVELFYNLDSGEGARFLEVRTACEALAGSEKIWRVDGDRGMADEAVAPVGPRSAVSVGLLETPEFSANVEIWGVEVEGGEKLFFLPECVLYYREKQYRAISYDSFGVIYGQSRRSEDVEVPGDAEVVGDAGKFSGVNGARRGSRNQGHPVVAYGMLAVTGISKGGTLRLLVSNKARAVRFTVPFGAGKRESQRQDASTAREARARRNAEAEAEKNSSLFRILGVEPGASQTEIHSAYKKKARMYHPDRVTSLAPEVREMAELRMKEINAAYGEIKRRNTPRAR